MEALKNTLFPPKKHDDTFSFSTSRIGKLCENAYKANPKLAVIAIIIAVSLVVFGCLGISQLIIMPGAISGMLLGVGVTTLFFLFPSRIIDALTKCSKAKGKK